MPKPGALLAILGEPKKGSPGGGDKDEPDARKEAARALISAVKKGSAQSVLDALDTVWDLKDDSEMSTDDLEDLDEDYD